MLKVVNGFFMAYKLEWGLKKGQQRSSVRETWTEENVMGLIFQEQIKLIATGFAYEKEKV